MSTRKNIILTALFISSFLFYGIHASYVHELENESFKVFINETDLALVEFYAPWCGHCKALAPEYEVAATELKDFNISLAKVDCQKEVALCAEEGIRGYPTLKVYKNQASQDYPDDRKADSIISFMKKMARPPVTELTADKVAAFSKEDKIVIIGFFSDNRTSDYNVFHNVASKLSDKYSFGFTTDPAAKEHYANGSSVVLTKKFDEGRNDYPKDLSLTEKELESFIVAYSLPLMDEIGPGNYASYLESGKPLAYLFVGTEIQRESLCPIIERVAKEFRADVNFVYIDAAKFGGHAKNLNLEEDWPAFAIHKPSDNTKYPFDQYNQITEASIREFVDDFVNGRLEPSIKSEPTPETNDGPVKIVVGNTYETIVLDKSKDVLLELYAPWCGHCKKLAPIWEELGAQIQAATSDIIIAKMDATLNDLPPSAGYQIKGFPTLKLIKANTNEVVEYSGEGRTVDSFIKFLKMNAVHKDSLKSISGAVGGKSFRKGSKQALLL